MAEQSRFSPESFLAAVQQELKGLDAREQRETLDEVRSHLKEAAMGGVESSRPDYASMKLAVAEMGDPAQLGRRLRDEQLARSLPWSYGLLAAVPIFALALYFELFPILVHFLVPRGQNPSSLIMATQGITIVLVMGVGIWGWTKGARFLIAPFAGIVIAFALRMLWTYLAGPWRQSGLHALVAPWVPVVSASGANDPSSSWLVVGPWVVAALAFLPLLALLTWWGRLAGSLALLGGIGLVTAFVWVDSPMSWLKLLSYLAVCLGLVAFVTAPRGRQATAAWVVLLVDWALVALGKWYFIVFEAPHAMNAQWRATHLPTLEGVWGEMPLAVMTFSIALLLALQIILSVWSNRRGSIRY